MNNVINDGIPESEIITISNGESDYLSVYQKVNELSKKNIEFQKPLMTFQGYPLIYPNSITAIQGGKGSHKSRFVETVLSAFLNRTSKPICSLELTNKDYYVILLDTERSIKEQFASAIQRIKSRAGFLISDEISNFFFTSTILIKRNERLNKFKDLITDLKTRYPDKHFIIAIDILTDLIDSFNDVQQSLGLTDFLNDLINNFDCSIIGIIHQNPSKDNDGKARGHLGTESVNKSSCVIQVSKEKESDLISIEYKHLRSNKQPNEKIMLIYNNEINGLDIVEKNQIPNYFNSTEKIFIDSIIQILQKGECNQKDLINELKPIMNLSENTLQKRLDNYVNGIYFGNKLIKTKKGKENIYSIKKSDLFD